MTRIWLSLCAAASVAACGPTPPPAQGVGFADYDAYAYSAQRARQAQLETPLRLSAENTGAPAATSRGPQTVTAADLSAAGIDTSSTLRVRQGNRVIHEPPAATGISAPALSRPRTVDPIPPEGAEVASASTAVLAPASVQVAQAPASQAAPLSALRPGALSDQSFAANPAPVTQVTAPVTSRPANTGPDIVAYALSTQHAIGAKQFRRSFASEAKARRACARYTGMDQAQRAFLAAGGPQRDRLGLDPDGDGFACAWSPEPFRAARSG